MSGTATAPELDRRTWKQAEVPRSGVEAAATPDSSLRIGWKNIERYRHPDADTPYPLEYAYHLLGDVTGQRLLDIGCGSGMNSVLAAMHGARGTGIDISPSLARLALCRCGFHVSRTRVFSLPHVNLAAVLPALQPHQHALYRLDGALLRRFPRLSPLATTRVVEMVKP